MHTFVVMVNGCRIKATNQRWIGNETGIRSICGNIVMRSLQHLLSQHFYRAGKYPKRITNEQVRVHT